MVFTGSEHVGKWGCCRELFRVDLEISLSQEKKKSCSHSSSQNDIDLSSLCRLMFVFIHIVYVLKWPLFTLINPFVFFFFLVF